MSAGIPSIGEDDRASDGEAGQDEGLESVHALSESGEVEGWDEVHITCFLVIDFHPCEGGEPSANGRIGKGGRSEFVGTVSITPFSAFGEKGWG